MVHRAVSRMGGTLRSRERERAPVTYVATRVYIYTVATCLHYPLVRVSSRSGTQHNRESTRVEVTVGESTRAAESRKATLPLLASTFSAAAPRTYIQQSVLQLGDLENDSGSQTLTFTQVYKYGTTWRAFIDYAAGSFFDNSFDKLGTWVACIEHITRKPQHVIIAFHKSPDAVKNKSVGNVCNTDADRETDIAI